MTDSSTPYRQIKIKKPVIKITEHDIDDMLQKLCRQQAAWSPGTRGALSGDKIIAEYSGWIGNKKVIDSGQKPISFILGSGQLVKKAQKSLIGTRPGDRVQICIKHKKDDSNLSLAGNQVNYEYHVLDVLEENIPPLDKKFARSFGIKSGSIKSLRKQVKNILRHQIDNIVRRIHSSIL